MLTLFGVAGLAVGDSDAVRLAGCSSARVIMAAARRSRVGAQTDRIAGVVFVGIDLIVRRSAKKRVRPVLVFGDDEQLGILERRDNHVAHLVGSMAPAELIDI